MSWRIALNKLVLAFTTLLLFAAIAAAEEFDAVVDDITRGVTKKAKTPDKFCYTRITLDSKGRLM
jgi:hypothetical protein